MSEHPATAPEPPVQSRWVFMGQVLRFQAKLLIDGLRDLVMSPVSMVAALVGLVAYPRDPGALFREVLAFGRRTEEWINLFGREQPEPGIDELFRKLEQRLENQYESGGVTRTAKTAVDASLDGLHRALRRLRQERGAPAEENEAPSD